MSHRKSPGCSSIRYRRMRYCGRGRKPCTMGFQLVFGDPRMLRALRWFRSVFLVLCLAPIALMAMSFRTSGAADTNKFVEAGIPEWVGVDYARAAEVLASRRIELPRISDELGRALLLRMTSLDNLSLAHDASIPLASRMGDLEKALIGVNSIMDLYIDVANKGGKVDNELARLMAFMLHGTAAHLELIAEFVSTIPNFQNDQVRMDGLRKIYEGMTNVFLGAEVSLSEKNVYTADDLTLLLEAMDATLPTFKGAFSGAFREELRINLRADKARFDKADDVQHIDRMLAELSL